MRRRIARTPRHPFARSSAVTALFGALAAAPLGAQSSATVSGSEQYDAQMPGPCLYSESVTAPSGLAAFASRSGGCAKDLAPFGAFVAVTNNTVASAGSTVHAGAQVSGFAKSGTYVADARAAWSDQVYIAPISPAPSTIPITALFKVSPFFHGGITGTVGLYCPTPNTCVSGGGNGQFQYSASLPGNGSYSESGTIQFLNGNNVISDPLEILMIPYSLIRNAGGVVNLGTSLHAQASAVVNLTSELAGFNVLSNFANTAGIAQITAVDPTTGADLTNLFSIVGSSGRDYTQFLADDALAAPEPTTWALLGTGLLALGAVARRRRSA